MPIHALLAVASALVLVLQPAAAAAQALSKAAKESDYLVTVWVAARFAADGTVESFRFSTLVEHPAAFLDQVRPVLLRARVPPAEHEGRPAVLDTGVRVTISISPDQQSFRVANLSLQPLPLRTFSPASPEMPHHSTPGRFTVDASCVVSIIGRCRDISLQSQGNPPEAFRRNVREAFSRWEFEPQRVNGQAIEGEAKMGFQLVVE